MGIDGGNHLTILGPSKTLDIIENGGIVYMQTFGKQTIDQRLVCNYLVITQTIDHPEMHHR